ncbi:MAG: hypothetical protein ACRD16_01245 [Thermoanaerobaculia bacterium]
MTSAGGTDRRPASRLRFFIENVAPNRGKNVKLFFGPEDDAVAWPLSRSRGGPTGM